MIIQDLVNIFLNINNYLEFITQNYGVAVYFILFAIIFLETGIVIAPFLPGDSLIFIVGTLAATGNLNVLLLFFIISAAAIIGDSVNYLIGEYLGERFFSNNRFFKKEYLQRTKDFYRIHGGKTIVLARFIPIIRTFAPFVAGVGKMKYIEFLGFNVVGGIIWVALFLFGGYYFGGIPFVKENLSLVVLSVIVISLLPVLLEYVRSKIRKN